MYCFGGVWIGFKSGGDKAAALESTLDIVTKTFQEVRMKVHMQHLTAEEKFERLVICEFGDQLKVRMMKNLIDMGRVLEETI